MDCILAKIKRHRVVPYRKLISNKSAFKPMDLATIDCVSYEPDHNLDEDSWFKIEEFSETKFFLEILGEDFDSKDYVDIEKADFKKIDYVISVQGDDFYFQNITRSSFISLKRIIFGEVARLEENSNQLTLRPWPDAIYFKQSDTLIFRDLSAVSGIFVDINTLYKEATQPEVESFLLKPFIELGDSYNVGRVSHTNRKRITLALEALSSLSDADQTKMFVYVNEYCGSDIEYDASAGTFKINSDKDLKTLLYGIQQRFYTTLFGQEKRLANSISVV